MSRSTPDETQTCRGAKTKRGMACLAGTAFGLMFLSLAASTSAQSPTQYEIAMLETVKGVSQGKYPDPLTRKPDGSPGSLLEALLPKQAPSEEARANTRRKLAAAWRLMGVNVPFALGPPYSSFNMSYFRYESVNALAALDWRLSAYATPVVVQYDCASCWAGAPVDAVSMGSAISAKVPAVPGSVQQLCDCGGGPCCQGGWPEVAFNWLAAQKNVTSASNYVYWAEDGRNCTTGSNYPIAGNITSWERVPVYSQKALMKAVSMQPVVAYISASSPDFIAYNSTAPGTKGFYVYKGNCTSEINHAVVVMGYNTTANPPYWIIKNSWPPWGWGDNGYIYMAMLGDGPGICGMQTVAPLYPTYFPNAPSSVQISASTAQASGILYSDIAPASSNVCSASINPCGAGKCYMAGGLVRCNCSAPYVEQVQAPTAKCVHPSPCTNSTYNPCGAGWCMDVGDGGYFCGCPMGYGVVAQVNGNPTCVPIFLVKTTTTYTSQNGDSCASIGGGLGITISQLQKLNPYLVCNGGYLVPGTVLVVPTQSQAICQQQYAVRPGDTCSIINYNLDYNRTTFLQQLNPAYWKYNASSSLPPPSLLYTVPNLTAAFPDNSNTLAALNPTLSCRNLIPSQLLCVNSPSIDNTPTIQCGLTYTTLSNDTCASVQASFNLNSSYLLQLNPGLNCRSVKAGIQLCVAAAVFQSTAIANCSAYYAVQQGDSCAQLWNAANLSQYQFLYINPGLQCQAPYLYVGQQVCINSSLLANIPDPNFITYTVQPGDTLATIQAKFTQQCQPFSITFSVIAQQNNVPNWTSWVLGNRTIVIPCVPEVGATCGCVPSLTVCGSDFINYPSYCDATCNFASPITTGACSGCQSACAGRYGLAPKPASMCAAGYVCPYPIWPPSAIDASKVFTCTKATGGNCLCQYRQRKCASACANSAFITGVDATACYSACFHCALVPCGGPSQIVPASSAFCGNTCTLGANVPCNPFGRTCMTQCSYWNNWWIKNSRTVPPYQP